MLLLEFQRRQRGWSQHQLGQLVRLGQSYISMIEVGRLIPTEAQLNRLGRALDVPPSALLTPVVIKEPEPAPPKRFTTIPPAPGAEKQHA